MKLYYSTTSPYSRKVLVLAHELGIADSLEIVRINVIEDTGELRQHNPLGKVPTLILNNGEALYDSPVIAEYFQSLVNKTALSAADLLEQNRLQALADGMMDAAVSLVLEGRRPEEQRSPFWQQRWEDAISHSLAKLEEKYLDEAYTWHLGSIAIACALDYLAFRLPENDWKQRYPKIKKWFGGIIDKPSMRVTDPRHVSS